MIRHDEKIRFIRGKAIPQSALSKVGETNANTTFVVIVLSKVRSRTAEHTSTLVPLNGSSSISTLSKVTDPNRRKLLVGADNRLLIIK